MRAVITMIVFCILIQVSAQDYRRSAGLRSGNSHGIEAKWFLNEENCLTAFLTVKNKGGLKLTAHKTNNQPFLWTRTDKLFAYWGWGAHIGLYNKYNYDSFMSPKQVPSLRSLYYTVVGLDGVLGMEYRFLKYPFVVAIEYIPYFDLFGPNYFNFHFGDGIVALKYTF